MNFIVGVAVVVLASFLCVCVLCGQGAVRVQRSVSLTNMLYRSGIYRAKTHGKDIRESGNGAHAGLEPPKNITLKVILNLHLGMWVKSRNLTKHAQA